MNDTALFTISKGNYGYNIQCASYSKYNYLEVPGFVLPNAMAELADIFNNTLKIGILFEIE